ncbi:elongation factor P hydroxylase [Halobacteriovorax marinus]|uniref:elongation factor P hydroxylase n=1 Tax=Halobacteriovorax marinus TaxID=97084 RepID=UPI003A90BDEE
MNNFSILDIQNIFNSLFQDEYKTELQYGADEPFYKSSKGDENHIIFCREDFFASALHEISHWCIAGEKRRKEDDYGYWYNPDDRSLEEQIEFEKVEIKPQAIEKAFSLACKYPFKPSLDNHSLPNYCASSFVENIDLQYSKFQKEGFPKRAQQFINALETFYS